MASNVRLIFTAGACPLDEAGTTVAVGDVAGQAEQAMANLRIVDAADHVSRGTFLTPTRTEGAPTGTPKSINP